ncbi:RNA 2'-phosphotransferase [Halalkalicoccus jeotgali B3]|uniref:Probable RNA 2'-phosphotransferase n=1 Tax=Halalkalicoccus jeotgali (strain DSM 18796 / CECT 7217 / JCM 14584 / KCTC 4019 / B3) TaxID=795797 RepID=D8J4I6_HALJB|nr:RNA 2'-phosphotransferase [Halalkalicoccus jeotgali B3]ELY32977.1 RNA 2'-phosphotransferase [Halalkalicoccus jeotgali B3]
MSEIRRCPGHGAFEGEACPTCAKAGERLLDTGQRRRVSKFMSGALRHFPDDVGLSLDAHGWTVADDLVAAVTAKYDWADPEAVAGVIRTDPKGRFERAGERVRAAYGHSVAVDLDAPETPVSGELYHGTAPENVPAIREEGLRPMDRQQVHLSGTAREAREVGRRHTTDPAVFVVDAAGMETDDHRIVRRGEGVYTTDRAPRSTSRSSISARSASKACSRPRRRPRGTRGRAGGPRRRRPGARGWRSSGRVPRAPPRGRRSPVPSGSGGSLRAI